VDLSWVLPSQRLTISRRVRHQHHNNLNPTIISICTLQPPGSSSGWGKEETRDGGDGVGCEVYCKSMCCTRIGPDLVPWLMTMSVETEMVGLLNVFIVSD
jgi:hypothetical protein